MPLIGRKHTDAVELASEYLKNNQSKAELPKRCSYVGTFECSLCGSDLDQLGGRQDHGAGTMETEAIAILSMVCLNVYLSDSCAPYLCCEIVALGSAYRRSADR